MKIHKAENFKRNVEFKKVHSTLEYEFESQDVLIEFEERFVKAKLFITLDTADDESKLWFGEYWYVYETDETIDEYGNAFYTIKNWMYLPAMDSDEWINIEDKFPNREDSPLDFTQTFLSTN